MRIYIAAPLFTQTERARNRALAAALQRAQRGWSVMLPQDFRAEGKFNDARHYPVLFQRCLEEIDRCQVLLAVLDGPDVDSGTAFEIGFAHARGKVVVGLRTDYRPGADHGVNMMCARACAYVVREFGFQEDAGLATASVVRRLQAIQKKQGF